MKNTKINKEEFDDIPVFYCKDCLSLKIRRAPMLETGYCDHCGNTDIGTTFIEEWEKMYRAKYGKDLLTK